VLPTSCMVAVEDETEGRRPGGRGLGQRGGGVDGGGDEVAVGIFGSLMWKERRLCAGMGYGEGFSGGFPSMPHGGVGKTRVAT
jgi:hypothetical protein